MSLFSYVISDVVVLVLTLCILGHSKNRDNIDNKNMHNFFIPQVKTMSSRTPTRRSRSPRKSASPRRSARRSRSPSRSASPRRSARRTSTKRSDEQKRMYEDLALSGQCPDGFKIRGQYTKDIRLKDGRITTKTIPTTCVKISTREKRTSPRRSRSPRRSSSPRKRRTSKK